MALPEIQALLEAGVHFGHQTRRWNPKMRRFIFAERNGIHIIDLAQTVARLDDALEFVRETTRRSESILFVGTKKQAQEAVREEANRSGQHYVDTRWLGGLLTNFMTIKRRIQRLEALEARREAGEFERLTKKEAGKLTEEIEKLNAAMGGIRRMRRLPGAVFIVDPHREAIAVSEARRLEIPVIAITDTNCNPDLIDWVIPANDDAIRSVRLLCSLVADACIAGAAERHGDVLALLGQRRGDLLRALIDAHRDVVADRGDVVGEVEMHAGDGIAHLLGLADQRVALVREGLEQPADADLVVVVSALER